MHIHYHIFSVYGNDPENPDGLDHSLTVFMDAKDTAFFARMLLDNTANDEEIEEPCPNGWVMTVENLDMSTTVYLTMTKEKLTMKMYVRDTQKSDSRKLMELEAPVKDRYISVTGEWLEEDHNRILLLCADGHGDRQQQGRKRGLNHWDDCS